MEGHKDLRSQGTKAFTERYVTCASVWMERTTMKSSRTMLAVAAAISLCIGGAFAADCPPPGKNKPMAEDGTHAPMEEADNNTASANATKKDGQEMPMGADKNLATSQQDVNAQQKGDKTAAAQADTKHETCPNSVSRGERVAPATRTAPALIKALI